MTRDTISQLPCTPARSSVEARARGPGRPLRASRRASADSGAGRQVGGAVQCAGCRRRRGRVAGRVARRRARRRARRGRLAALQAGHGRRAAGAVAMHGSRASTPTGCLGLHWCMQPCNAARPCRACGRCGRVRVHSMGPTACPAGACPRGPTPLSACGMWRARARRRPRAGCGRAGHVLGRRGGRRIPGARRDRRHQGRQPPAWRRRRGWLACGGQALSREHCLFSKFLTLGGQHNPTSTKACCCPPPAPQLPDPTSSCWCLT